MGICNSNQKKLVHKTFTEFKNIGFSKPNIPKNLTDEIFKSICKIIFKVNEGAKKGAGFFMKISESKNYLITTYQNISEKNINEDIEIEIYNQKKMKLEMNGRDVKFFSDPKKDRYNFNRIKKN